MLAKQTRTNECTFSFTGTVSRGANVANYAGNAQKEKMKRKKNENRENINNKSQGATKIARHLTHKPWAVACSAGVGGSCGLTSTAHGQAAGSLSVCACVACSL